MVETGFSISGDYKIHFIDIGNLVFLNVHVEFAVINFCFRCV